MPDLKWFEHYPNLSQLTRYLADEGWTGREVADVVEKPWCYHDEFEAAQRRDEDDDRDCGCRGTDTCMECTSPDDYEPALDGTP